METFQPPTQLLSAVQSQKKHGKPPDLLGLLRRLAKSVRYGVDCVVDVGGSTYNVLGNAVKPTTGWLSAEEERRQLEGLRFNCATELESYLEIAGKLDELDCNEEWKEQDESAEYDYELVSKNLKQLGDSRKAGDFDQMRRLLRTALTRDLGGMGNVTLYSHSYIGTKKLIERYIETVEETLEAIVSECRRGDNPVMDAGTMHDEMKKTRQAFGRTALLLSGGGTLGMKHIGVVSCLREMKLLPRIISGTSAGSIVAAVACVKKDTELEAELTSLCRESLDVFEKMGEEKSVAEHTIHFVKTGYLYDTTNLKRVLRGIMGDCTFQQAYSRTRRILNITVSGVGQFAQSRLLNYMTAPDVAIWSAVAASCSVPGIFTPASLLAVDQDTGELKPWGAAASKWIDGSVMADIPIKRLSEMFNVNHFLVSQTNVHIVPLCMKEEDEAEPNSMKPSSLFTLGSRLIETCVTNAHREVCHRLDVLAALGLRSELTDILRGALNQRYTGDITILPDIELSELKEVLRNPTEEFMKHARIVGERATWPKLSRIKNHLAQELDIDEAVHQLAELTHFSPSQADLRLKAYARPPKPSAARRGGSRNSHMSARSTIVPRETPGRSGLHRSVHSMPPTPLMTSENPALKVTGYDSTSSEDSQDTVSAAHRSEYEEDTDKPLSETTLDSPPSPQPRDNWHASRQLHASAPATPTHTRMSYLSLTTPSFPSSSEEAVASTATHHGGPRAQPSIHSEKSIPPAEALTMKQGLSRKLSKLTLASAFDVRRNHRQALKMEKERKGVQGRRSSKS